MLKHRIAAGRNGDIRNDKGFTLIELLIVIVVLGVLAGIVVFGVGTFRADSVSAACKANAKSVEVASQAFIAKSATGTPAANVDALVTAKYLQEAPVPAVDYDSSDGSVDDSAC